MQSFQVSTTSFRELGIALLYSQATLMLVHTGWGFITLGCSTPYQSQQDSPIHKNLQSEVFVVIRLIQQFAFCLLFVTRGLVYTKGFLS